MAGDRPPLNYDHLVRWFRREWHAEMGSGRIHVRETDAGGAPEWHERFKGILEEPPSPAYPLRFHLREMAKASLRGHRRAEFLFRLACLDFDLMAAGRATSRLACHVDSEDWLRDYAEVCLWRLYRRAHAVEHNDLENKPRRYLPRVGKSDAQLDAEKAAGT